MISHEHGRFEDFTSGPPWIGMDLSAGRDFGMLVEIREGKMTMLQVFDPKISDRVFPDVEQMLLDCAQANR